MKRSKRWIALMLAATMAGTSVNVTGVAATLPSAQTEETAEETRAASTEMEAEEAETSGSKMIGGGR